MEAVKEIVRMNRLMEVEELAFQGQLEDAVSLFTFSPYFEFPFGIFPFPFGLTILINVLVDRGFLTPALVLVRLPWCSRITRNELGMSFPTKT